MQKNLENGEIDKRMTVHVLYIESGEMVFEKIFNRLQIGKNTKLVNPATPFFVEFCPVTPIFYLIFRCPIKIPYTKSE